MLLVKSEQQAEPKIMSIRSRPSVTDSAFRDATSDICRDAGVLSTAAAHLSADDQMFLHRVWSRPIDDYIARLQDIGFASQDRILDAGAGMGQWSVALAALNRHVWAVDLDSGRISVIERIAKTLDLGNLSCATAPLEATPFKDESFDAIFCYSVLYVTDIRAVLKELHRVLAPGGYLYISTNSWGYYIRNLLRGRAVESVYDPRLYAWQALAGNAVSPWWSRRASRVRERIIGPRALQRLLIQIGFEPDIMCGPEGTLSLSGMPTGPAFYAPAFLGLTTVFDVLAKKQSSQNR